MLSSASVRLVVVTCLAGSMISGFASPGISSQESFGRCPPFDPATPESDSGQASEARKAKVWLVPRDATKGAPLVIESEHGTSLWSPLSSPVTEDTVFVNLQAPEFDTRGVRLNAMVTWDSPRQLEDVDFFAYDSRGKEIDSSTRPTGQQRSREFISLPADGCEGFTFEVRAYRTLETTTTLHVWLNRPPASGYSCDC